MSVAQQLNQTQLQLVGRPDLQPAVDMLGSIKIKPDQTGATLTGLVPREIINAMVGQMSITDLGLGGMADDAAPPAVAAPAPPIVPAVPEMEPMR